MRGDTTRALAVILGIILVVIAVLAACYLGSWWLFADSTRRQGEIRRDTFEFQQGSVDAAQQKVTEIHRIDVQISTATGEQQTALVQQRRAIVDQTCQLIARVNGALPTDLDAFRVGECR